MYRKPQSQPASEIEFSIIVPTLNERTHISQFLDSLHRQSAENFEVIVVDGGSQDGTAKIAESLGARVLVLEGSKEFEARNYAAARSKAPILVFSCADVVLPQTSLRSVSTQFKNDSDLVALTGPDVPYDGGPILRFTYAGYNVLRLLFSRLPHPFKVFSSSTNFLAVRKEAFQYSGGFKTDDVNADGLMGKYLVERYRISFDNKVIIYISARRALNWGIARFAIHYLYVLENFFPAISNRQWFRSLKSRSGRSHGAIHDNKPSLS